MTCIIIEDQPPAQRILKKYIDDLGGVQLLATFSDAPAALDFLKKQPVNLIFLDIHLPGISGLDFLKILPNPPAVILTTAFADYALVSYEFSVADYLLKPFSFQRFEKAVAKVPAPLPAAELEPPRELFIKSGHELIKIQVDDIFFIKSDADYTEIVLEAKKYLSAEPLRHWSENLDSARFLRVHKSYIVNTRMIRKIAGNQMVLVNGVEIPIGRAYREGVRRLVNV